MTTTPNPRRSPAEPPTPSQLQTARAARLHQDGSALLSLEATREWLRSCGLVLWAPMRELQTPAPSMLEAVAGASGQEITPEQKAAAHSLLVRLVAEGSAVPLCLNGTSGSNGTDQPDFLASAAAFSFLYTLRGAKNWKQAPETSGPLKVSPLAVAAYEALSAKVTLSAYDLTTELGKEVTESSVLRALTELWTQMRVLPIPQADGSVLWELATTRLSKQIKAGANAGQPTAMSALISLYLAQVVAATEEEIETFLSPVSARSRSREVLHALTSARQLESVVVEGKTLLHVSGELPTFGSPANAKEPAEESGEGEQSAPEAAGTLDAAGTLESTGDGSRITRLRPAKAGAKPGFAKPGFARPDRAKPFRPQGERTPRSASFQRRPFPGSGSGGDQRPPRSFAPRGDGAAADRGPRFDQPWKENDRPRAPRPQRFGQAGEEAGGQQERPRRFTPADRPAGNSRFSGGDRSSGQNRFQAGRPDSGSGARAPRRDGEGSTFERRAPRAGGFAAGGDRGPRKNFGSGSGQDRGAGYGSDRGSDRPFRPTSDRSFRPAGDRPFRPAGDRPAGQGSSQSFGARRSDSGFAGGAQFGAGAGSRRPSFGGDRPSGDRPNRPAFRSESGSGGAEQGTRPFRRFDAPRGDFGANRAGGDRPFSRPRSEGNDRERPAGNFPPRSGSFYRGEASGSGRPAFSGKKPFGAGQGAPRKPGFGKPSFGDAGRGGTGGFQRSGNFRSGDSFAAPGRPRPEASKGPVPRRKDRDDAGGFKPVRRQEPEGE